MSPNNTLDFVNDLQISKSVTDVLDKVTQHFLFYLPLIFFIFGLTGFVGNVFTYLQVELRSNTCCIYSLSGSVIDIINLSLNSFPNYLAAKYGISIPWYRSSILCKFNLFLLVFLPHLSINFSLMAIVDRFAATSDLASPVRRLNHLKMIPWMTGLAIIISFLASLYAPILFDLRFEFWCVSTQPTITSILYIVLFGLMQPAMMLMFVLLTYGNIRRSRQRVDGLGGTYGQSFRNQFIATIFTQVLCTGFFSLQWIIVYMYFTFTMNDVKSVEQSAIIYFVFTLSNNLYYMNNVKSFYLAMLTCHLFRKTFLKASKEVLTRYACPRVMISQPNVSIQTLTKKRRIVGLRS